MSNKRALWKVEDYVMEIAKCDYIISRAKNYKTRNDFTKRRERLKAELRAYYMFREGLK